MMTGFSTSPPSKRRATSLPTCAASTLTMERASSGRRAGLSEKSTSASPRSPSSTRRPRVTSSLRFATGVSTTRSRIAASTASEVASAPAGSVSARSTRDLVETPSPLATIFSAEKPHPALERSRCCPQSWSAGLPFGRRIIPPGKPSFLLLLRPPGSAPERLPRLGRSGTKGARCLPQAASSRFFRLQESGGRFRASVYSQREADSCFEVGL